MNPNFSTPGKVLHVYAGNLYGGVETFLVSLASTRSFSRIQASFGLCFEGRLSQELRAAGAPVHMLGEVRFSRPWTVGAARQRLNALMRREEFDALICHSVWPHAVFAPVARRQKLPLAYWAHNPPSSNWVDRRAARTPPDLVIANSQFTASQHQALFAGVPLAVARCPVKPPPIESPAQVRQEVRREFGSPDDEVVIVCSSRLEAWKGHHLLLDAFGRMRDLAGWRAWIAGAAQRPSEGRYLAQLVTRIEREQLQDRVRFIGQRNDIPRVLCAADIHCQPNTGPEPFGIAFIEAMYAGLPVVTTAMGAATEIVTPFTGRLVAPDAAALAGALMDLVVDEDARRRVRREGPRRAAELCDPRVAITGIEELLMDLLSSRAGVRVQP